MTPVKFASLVRYYTKTNSTTFTDADILLLANVLKDEMCAEIAELNEDYFVMRFYRNLDPSQPLSGRSYAFPAEALTKIKFVQAKLDGSKWSHLTEFDINSFKRPIDEASIIESWTGREPQFDIIARALVIYSSPAIISVTDGLVLHSTMYPADLTSLAGVVDMSEDPTATTFGIPRPMHELLARRVSIAFKSSKDKPIPLSEKEKQWEVDWQRVKDTMKGQNLDRTTVPSMPVLTGEDL